MLFSARALQSNEAALWLYARVRAPPTSAAEGCEDREIWKGSWTSAGSRLRWSLVRSFGVVMCARREREAAEGGPELPLELPFEGRKSVGQEEPRLWESRAGDDLVDALVDGDREGALLGQ